MSRAVRNVLVFAGLLALVWVLLVLVWRIGRWLFVVAFWLIALALVGAILLTQVVTQHFPRWITQLRASRARDRSGTAEIAP